MVAEAAVSVALLKLGDLLKQKANFLLGGVAREVEQLIEELKVVQCFLRDAAQKQGDNEMIRNWISETREVAHEAEDAVEVFIFKVERARMMLGRFASSPNHMYRLNKLSRVIKSIRKKLHALEKSRLTYGIQDLAHRPSDAVGSSNTSQNVVPLRRLAEWQKDKHVVGLEKDVELLLEKAILDGRDDLSIAAIIGVGGIGKSTLARVLQNHVAVADRFERRAWAVASEKFIPRDIIKELWLQLMTRYESEEWVKATVEKLELPNLLQLLYQRLQGKRYFIVLDNVWDDQHWDVLSSAFPDEGNGSRLLLTSPNPTITDYVHTMKCLDSDKSWMLFLKTVSDYHIGLEDLEDIGRQIVNKCNGLPLAITLSGGLLMKQRWSAIEWERVLKEMEYHLNRSTNDTMQAILELSYQKLPPELKSCFLCLSLFKENTKISAQKLIDVWIAEGFVVVPQGGGETIEEMARSYLEELTDRNMVQIKEIATDGRVRSCEMHDLVYALSLSKAEEDIRLEIIKEDGKCESESSVKPRHRVLHCSSGRFNDTIYGNKHIRSLVIHGARPYLYTTPFSSYWMSFQLLRMLDFEGCDLMTRLPNAISSLIGLRYLSLRDTKLSGLPNWLPSLINLEVLDLRGSHNLELSEILGKMSSLRHLYAFGFYFKKRPNLTALKHLQTLNYVNFNEADVGVLSESEMTSLCKLGLNLFKIYNPSRLFFLLGYLKKLVHLNLNWPRDLDLNGLGFLDSITRLRLRGDIPSLPQNFPPNLVQLSLVWSGLKEDPMPFLQKLPKLVRLKLDRAYEGEEMVIPCHGFRGLKVLSLRCLWRLKNVRVEEGALPELRRLEITECKSLKSLPEEVKQMRNLEELKIVASAKIATKVRADDSHIISNIPYVQIIDDRHFD